MKCPLVTNHLEINSSGEFKPCCISSKRFAIDNKIANADTHTIDDIIQHSDRNEWIKNFDANYETDCRQCYEVERSGGESKRIRELRDWRTNYHFKTDTLQSLDLKMGNTCNLACAICAPDSSSKWASIYKQLGYDTGIRLQRWPERDEFWEQLNQHAHNIQKIELAGGEPFMIKKQEILINFLIERDLAKNIDITWFTNCTIWPENIVKHFDKFKQVRIMLSIDNTDEQFEYIRYPAKWNEAYDIFLKFKELHSRKIVNLGISHSIGLLNVWRLPEFHAWCRQHEVSVFNNLIMNPLSAKDLPKEFKLRVAEKLSKCSDPSYQHNPVVGENNWLIQFMMGDSDNNLQHLTEKVIPSRQTIDIYAAFPELKGMLNV